MVDLHHIISDGVSQQILIQEFTALYTDIKVILPGLKLQYKDFSQWHNSDIREASIKKQQEYWLKVFPGEIPVLNLPSDYTRPAVQGFQGKQLSFIINKEETQALKSVVSEEGTTLFLALLAIFKVFLFKTAYFFRRTNVQ